ncbi:MAG: tetratricopeptide repeat protein [Hyphomicrobiaceae bacterium]|nr:tetratricopeptide repeat protein [Hyphomicrobiaceae bacterium]
MTPPFAVGARLPAGRWLAIAASMLMAGTIAATVCGTAAAAPDDGTAGPAKTGAAAQARGELNEAVTTYSTALANTALANDRRAMLLNDRGVAYGRLGQTRQAFEDFNKAVQLFPEFAAIYNNRGSLLLRLGLLKEAIKDFDRALVLAPGYAAAYNNRAGALMKTGEFEPAIRDFTRAIKLLPSAAPPLSGRGLAHLQLGRPHAAIRDFSRALKSDTTFASGYRNRAEAKLAVSHYDEAIEDLSRAIAFDISNADMYRLRGRAYLLMGENAAAIKDFSQAIALNPSDARSYAERGIAHGRDGRSEDAMADLARAIELEPRSARAFAYRAFVYKEANQADVGMKDISMALKLDADNADVLWAKAELEDAIGQRDQAVSDLRRALFLDPSMKLAADALDRLGGDATPEGTPVPGLDYQGWSVVARGKQFYAINPAFRRLQVPLEMMGEGQPKLVSWEPRSAPHQNIGVLTYDGGMVPADDKPERTEFAAIVNTQTASVLAIEPHRQGRKVATWVWSDAAVTVEAVDGVTDEIQIGVERRPVAAAASRRRYSTARGEQWAPWEQPWAGPQQYAPAPRRERVQRRKPKTLFDLLFN